MNSSLLSPLAIRNSLAANPSHGPLFAVSIDLPGGRRLSAADPTAVRAVIALMNTHAVMGGAACHYGGPAALSEINSALYALVFEEARAQKRPWHELFHLVNDAGHTENGLYALKALYGFAGLDLAKLKKFRSIESPLTGHGESHLFREGVFISNGPLGSSLPQAQGLAMGDYLAGHKRVTVTTISDGGCMEGEAKEALSAIPGLASKGQLAPFVMIISDNDTKLSGRISQDSFSMEPTFRSLGALGWKVLELTDGHDLNACARILEQALSEARANPQVPVAVHARTIKGKGTKKTEQSSSGGHGFPLKGPTEVRAFVEEIYAGQTLPAELQKWTEELSATVVAKSSGGGGEPTEKIQGGVSRALIDARKRGRPVVSITSDLPGSTGVAEFRKACPEGQFDVGVAEANMVSTAVGLSKLGYIPVVDTFAQFGVTKGALPLLMASLSEGPLIAIFSHTGFQDAADGASHQALSYFAMTGSIPHAKVIALTCADEAEALVTQAIERFAQDRERGQTPPSTIFFLGRENFPRHYGVTRFELGQAQVLTPNWQTKPARVVLAVAGSLIPEALRAQAQLERDGIRAIVVNPSIINHPDIETFRDVLAQSGGNLVTAEDHQVIGGFGAQLIHALAQAHIPMRVQSLGVHDEFGRSAYQAQELYRLHKLDAESMVAAARKLLS